MTVEERIEDGGFEDVITFKDYDYETAFIDVSDDNRAIYDYEKMLVYLVAYKGMTESEAIEWIDYNTIRTLPYVENAPIIMYTV